MRPSPRLLLAVVTFVAVAACSDPFAPDPEPVVWEHLVVGADHACAADGSGNVFCWGGNDRGQLSASVGAFAARPVLSIIGTDVEDLTAGSGYTCRVSSEGQAICWGAGDLGQLGNGRPFQSPIGVLAAGGPWDRLMAGPHHTCGIAGTITQCWGGDRYGAALGVQLPTTSRCTNTQTGETWWCALDPELVASPEPFTSVTAGAFQSCGLGASGAVYCWGQNEFSQLGFDATDECFIPESAGTFSCAFVPGRVPLPGPARQVHAGGTFTCAVLVAGDGYCWGSWFVPLGLSPLYFGQLGDGSTQGSRTPVRVALNEPIASITSTQRDIFSSACGLTEEGRAYCWGSHQSGALGGAAGESCEVGPNTFPCSRTPIPVATDARFLRLEMGEAFACGLTTGKQILCWGRNDKGQLGDGTTTSRAEPRPVVVAL